MLNNNQISKVNVLDQITQVALEAEQTSAAIDRKGYDSLLLAIPLTANLTTSETVTGTLKIQESANNSDWSTAETLKSAGIVLSTTDPNATAKVMLKYNDNLATRERYIRFLTTFATSVGTNNLAYSVVPILSNGITETFTNTDVWTA
jgi:hypothetical protein